MLCILIRSGLDLFRQISVLNKWIKWQEMKSGSLLDKCPAEW